MATMWIKKEINNKSQIFRHLLLLTTQQESLIVATTVLTHSYPKMGRTFPGQSDLDFFFLSLSGWNVWMTMMVLAAVPMYDLDPQTGHIGGSLFVALEGQNKDKSKRM